MDTPFVQRFYPCLRCYGVCRVEIAPVSSVVDDLASCERTCLAYRTVLGVDGAELPADFGEVVEAVTTFADRLADASSDLRWHAAGRRWIAAT